MMRQIALSVLGKISNLLVQESDSLLGVEDQIQCIETLLKTIYDLEDVIDELIIKSAQRSNRDVCIRYVSAFVHLPMYFSYFLALVDLLDHYGVRERLEQIKIKISVAYTTWLLETDEFRFLNDFIEDIEQSKQLSEVGMAWMEELCDVCRSTEKVVGLSLQRMKNGRRGPFENLAWAPQNFISQRKLFLDEAIPRSMSGSNNDQSLYQQGKPLPRDADQLDMVSFDEDVDAVMAQLLKDDPRCITISIVGVGRIGKTSLAKLIYDSQTIADHFPHRIWVSRATEFDIIERIFSLVNAFFLDKKYLIVVDDLCLTGSCLPREFWTNMGRVFNDIPNRTRILFTIRNFRQAPPVIETSFTYRLHLRSHDESWALFTHTLKVNVLREMQNLKGHIIRTCGGLPKVILKLREPLSQRDATLEEWSRILDRLNQDQEPWLEILDEINKYLPLYLRRCLFYFGLFPVGRKISARRLIALRIAEGLGCQQSNEKSPEYAAEACLREIMNYNMVQVTEKKLNGKVKKCCLPEALQVHWFSKAKEANFLQGHFHISNTNIGVKRRLADHLQQNDGIFDDIHGYKNASSYSLQGCGSRPGEDIGNFLDRSISSNCFRSLWLLDLETVYRPKLPKAVGQLTRLRYLGLGSTYLEMLPVFINKLLNLQTLDLKRTCINTLPSSIWKMQKLRHLFLDESFRNTFVPRQEDSSLVDLQTLWGAFIDEDSPVRNGLDASLNIKKWGLKCKISVPSQNAAMSSQLVDVANWIVKLEHLQSLRLKSFDKSGQPWDLHLQSMVEHVDLSNVYLVGKLKNQHLASALPRSLIELTFSASGLVEDPVQTLAKLTNLRIVRLFFGGFPKLEVLKFWELELLEWNVEEGALTSLKDLEIRPCGNLKMLPDGLQHVRTLSELKLTKLPMVSSRIKDNLGAEWNKIAHIRHVWKED
ncbi:hypothetical protein P3X46_010426 [Hevea brasiliensis]|uniref:NB-ARC domain-containing protein n=1 Tax=Hevea brasiliensis TaxID=3981 RepID=A0ABQ9MGR3_HEVBR|nr:hypothetical protein P3X46_010426 [Hevea brasiliensis]